MSRTSKRSPSSMTTCCVRGSWAKRTISSAVIWRGLTVTSIPACSNTSTDVDSWTIATREPRAVDLGERRGEVVLQVVAHGEDRDLRVRDPLALEEVGVEAGGVVDARVGQLRRHEPRPLARRLDQAHADLLLEQEARDRRAGAAGAEDDDVGDLARPGHDQRAPRLCRLGRADHDDPVARLDRLVAARDHDLVAPDDRGDAGVGRDLRLAQRHAEEARIGLGGDVELDELHLPIGEDVRLARRRDGDRARDRIRRLDLGRDDEVDVELALAPDLEVLGVRGADDGRRPRASRPSRSSRRRCSTRRGTCRRSGGRPR